VNEDFISPLFYVGIFVIILPVLLNIFHIPTPGWTYGLGMGVLILGAAHTVWKRR
jgi:hypothetical protein